MVKTNQMSTIVYPEAYIQLMASNQFKDENPMLSLVIIEVHPILSPDY
jgi:hypothetical protein